MATRKFKNAVGGIYSDAFEVNDSPLFFILSRINGQ
ncbi:hypothetical protein ABIC55_002058 [Sporosarcina psychrophila]|uniref:Uncharacterized protein n=1 Tax=Sporosarcina psychrophila TaxID=1476 RepID=A0ABV2K7C0_SPOPS